LLRHSKFAGLCEDKEARTVGKEQAGESWGYLSRSAIPVGRIGL